MKLVVSIALREYEGAVFIAQTLDPPVVSAAAETADEAVSRLRGALAHVLGHVHPRVLSTLPAYRPPRYERVDLPLYGTSSYDWYQEESPQLVRQAVEVPVDVLRRAMPDGLEEVRLPVFGAWTHAPAASPHADNDESDVRDDEGSAATGVLADLAAAVREHDDNAHVHRPVPREFSLIALEVDFEPVDLTRVAFEALWESEFDDEMLLDVDEEGRPPTPTLDEVAQCWTEAPAEEAELRGFEPVYHREAALSDLRALVEGSLPSPVVLVGPSRVGKTALVRHLAWERITGASDSSQRIWFANPPRLVSADPMSAGWQQQCRDALAELEEADDLLYLGRAIEALDAGKYVGSDYNLAQFLKPMLTDRRIRVVAEATVEEWNDVERRDLGFARAFTVVRVDDPPEAVAFDVVSCAAARRASREEVELSEGAVRRAWSLQKRFATDGSPVGRTIDFLGRTLRRAANQFAEHVDETLLVDDFCRDTGLPPVMLLDDRQLDLERVRQRLSERVMGQPEAVRRVVDVVGITKAGLSSPERPLGSFLFVGPTGVGKTELARALASFLFGDDDRLIRLDMSEYSHPDAYGRLIGEGSEEGDLTGPVRRQPFSVVLLDELEKAHAGVFDLLLQVLGEARLTDVNGRTTRFQNTIVIMTSNLGVDSMRPAIGFGADASRADAYADHFHREAERFFRPEFLARIDQFIPFGTLSRDIVTAIARRELAHLGERDGLRAQDVELSFAPEVAAWLAARGWDARYGARPLKRVVEQEVAWRLAEVLAAGRPELDTGSARQVLVRTSHDDLERAKLVFDVEVSAPGQSRASARQELLGQIDTVATLRRRLQRYMYTTVFGDLEWEVENFDISSQSPQFWDDPNAAVLAQRAEHARRVLEPARELASELAALEDLATEAYHTRSFALAEELTGRSDELEARSDEIVMTVLRAAYEEPDRAALFIRGRQPDDPWRARWVEWLRRRCQARGWEMVLWRPLTGEVDAPYGPGDQHFDDKRHYWERTDSTRADVLGIEITGYAARPLTVPEDGLHRLIAPDGNAVIDVVRQDEYTGWPFPESVVRIRPYAQPVRAYNFRTGEVQMAHGESFDLDVDNPWPAIESVVEELAWELTENDWE